MSEIVIWHNPRCSKSRQTLALLEERGLSPRIVRYLDTPPTTEQLQKVLQQLKLEPSQLARKGEALWKELGLDDASEAQILAAMAEHPRLIERPVVINGERAALGRPPEQVKEIL